MMRRMLISTVAVVATVAAAAPSASAGGASISLKATPRIVDFTKPTKLIGRLSSGRRGVPVVLEASRFPFTGGFGQVAEGTTGKHGKFRFKERQSAATRYFVALKGDRSVRSKRRTAYVEAHVLHNSCVFRDGHGTAVPCGSDLQISGSWTFSLVTKLRYPASAYATESKKPNYWYFGQRSGSAKPPDTLQLKGSTSQTPIGANAVQVSFSVPVAIPTTAWSVFATSCAKGTEAVDGLGLPGDHHCGDPSITYQQATRYLG